MKRKSSTSKPKFSRREYNQTVENLQILCRLVFPECHLIGRIFPNVYSTACKKSWVVAPSQTSLPSAYDVRDTQLQAWQRFYDKHVLEKI